VKEELGRNWIKDGWFFEREREREREREERETAGF
jgi:hypothetical protein